MNPVKFYKCLADETRLSCLLLIDKEKELCVCELTDALDVPQPKISRHLASLRQGGIVSARKQDQWVHYAINTALAGWAQKVITDTRKSNNDYIHTCSTRLHNSKNRPSC